MKKPVSGIGVLVALLLAAALLPAAAMAEEAIPPGNSAVNQYTESLPTGTGHADTEKGGAKVHRSPDITLGKRNAEKLESHGADGRAAAKAAAETAPTSSVPPAGEGEDKASTAPPADSGGGGDGKAGSGNAESGQNAADQGAGKGSVDKVVLVKTQIEEPSGSSGLGEALGEATGASSAGQMGWLLPLMIIGTAAWAIAYAMRQRRRVE